MASWFIQATVTINHHKILQINEEAVPDNTKKATKFSLAVFSGKVCLFNLNIFAWNRQKFFFCFTNEYYVLRYFT